MQVSNRIGEDPASPASTITTRLEVNGKQVLVTHEADQTLLDLLREELGLTGTKKVCDQGACGACTVLVDSKRVLSCLTLAAQCDERNVTTIEELAARRERDVRRLSDSGQRGRTRPRRDLRW